MHNCVHFRVIIAHTFQLILNFEMKILDNPFFQYEIQVVINFR